jgi:enoyl-CoA hydratase
MTIQSNFETLKFEQLDGLATLTIDREKSLNALNSQVLSELKDILTQLKSEKGIHGMILTGAGEKAFIAGADIKEMQDMTKDQASAFGKLGQDVSLLFEEQCFPVIACVNGFALGGGCEMAMACDFIYASESAVFGQPEVKLGLIPGFGGTQRLSRLIGRNRAKELVYSGRNMDAAEALSTGLAVRVLKDKSEALEAAKETISKIARVSPLAVSLAKKVMNSGNDLTVSQGLDHELGQFAEIFTSEDMKEGTQAFIEKRKPVFKGQ